MADKYIYSIIAGDISEVTVVDGEVGEVGYGIRRKLRPEEAEAIIAENRFNRNFPSGWPNGKEIEVLKLVPLQTGANIEQGNGNAYEFNKALVDCMKRIYQGAKMPQGKEMLQKVYHLRMDITVNLYKCLQENLLCPVAQGKNFDDFVATVASVTGKRIVRNIEPYYYKWS